MEHLSKGGLMVAGAFILIAAISYVYSSFCVVDFCWGSLFWVTMPWMIFLNSFLPFDMKVVISILINAGILYFLGKFAEKMIRTRKAS